MGVFNNPFASLTGRDFVPKVPDLFGGVDARVAGVHAALGQRESAMFFIHASRGQ